MHNIELVKNLHCVITSSYIHVRESGVYLLGVPDADDDLVARVGVEPVEAQVLGRRAREVNLVLQV